MVQAIINLGEHEDRILNIIKGKFGLKNKSDAVNLAILKFEESIDPELRPEYMAKLQGIKKQKGTRFKSVEELRKKIENA
ncbi:antitoxin [Candidatus Woesearchaeota archaeon CG10_big_fil_rev_8_21_14_0_10_44_13]|nr:MAG: antitoxin [Candidatus Woesearchaeota archaeon CG10_big_fil_rev_8_21_14_0_10_44_13]